MAGARGNRAKPTNHHLNEFPMEVIVNNVSGNHS